MTTLPLLLAFLPRPAHVGSARDPRAETARGGMGGSISRLALAFFTTLALALAAVLPATMGLALAYVPPPIAGMVNDPGNQLTAAQKATLNAKLDAHMRTKGDHVVVFLPTTLGGESIEDVAYTTFNTWKIGAAGKDNGVLLIIAKNERKARIETGKGVGGDLPDLKTHQILASSVTPQMKVGNTFGAVDQGTTEIIRALGGTATSTGGAFPVKTTPYKSGSSGSSGAGAGAFACALVAFVLAVVLIVTFLIIRLVAKAAFGGRRGGGGGGVYWSGSSNDSSWNSSSSDSSWSSSSSDSSWSSSDSSSSDWGSSGGSDYSGGGGESGGGGSSDSW